MKELSIDNKTMIIKNETTKIIRKFHKVKEKDWFNNKIHLSGYSGLINDPNGLVFHNGLYYIFLQNTPFSPRHWNKSWCLFTTKDFIDYNYEGITITPSYECDINGAFSGNAFVNAKNELVFYYTGNVIFDKEKDQRTSYTIIAKIDMENKKVYKKELFEVDKEKYTGHFRDPFVFQYNKDTYMLNGAQSRDGKGLIDIKKYNIKNKKWNFVSNTGLNFETNYMIECASLINDNNDLYLISSVENKDTLDGDNHKTWYTKVEFDGSEISAIGKPKKIDFGYDFYAPQFIKNIDRNIMFGWLGNSKSKTDITNKNLWFSQLTIPREVNFKNGKMYQQPIKEITKLRTSETNDLVYKNGLKELIVDEINNDFSIRICNSKNDFLGIEYINGSLFIKRDEMTFNDSKNLPNFNIKKIKVNKIHLIIDRSVVELFINDGENVISINFFVKKHNNLKITGIDNLISYNLRKINIKSSNIVFENIVDKNGEFINE